MICALIAQDNDCYIYKSQNYRTNIKSNQFILTQLLDRRAIKPHYYATTTKTLEVFFFFITLGAACLPTINHKHHTQR